MDSLTRRGKKDDQGLRRRRKSDFKKGGYVWFRVLLHGYTTGKVSQRERERERERGAETETERDREREVRDRDREVIVKEGWSLIKTFFHQCTEWGMTRTH